MSDGGDQVSSQIAAEVVRAARGGGPVAVATVVRAAPAGAEQQGATLPMGAKLLVRRDGTRLGSLAGGEFEEAVAEDCAAALTSARRNQAESRFYSRDGSRLERASPDCFEVLVEVTERPASLLIVGAGHVGHSLAVLGAHVGFAVTVIDDRAAFANEERFPMADRVICGDIIEEIGKIDIGETMYVVLVSRGHKQDEEGLRAVVDSGAAYVGMIGSRRRVGTVLTHLAREGYDRAVLERVHTPVGLDIGAETPEEIAVSILAEIIAVRRGGSGGNMSALRKAKITE